MSKRSVDVYYVHPIIRHKGSNYVLGCVVQENLFNIGFKSVVVFMMYQYSLANYKTCLHGNL